MIEAKGSNGTITVDDHFITISREGTTGFNRLNSRLYQGFKGEKRIPISSVTAVQFKAVGGFGQRTSKLYNTKPLKKLNEAAGNTAGSTGYIQFTVPGGNENTSKALIRGWSDLSRDENTVMFSPEHEEAFMAVRDFVEQRIAQRGMPSTPPPAASADLASQLSSLKELHDSGVLSEEEFAAAKRKLLG